MMLPFLVDRGVAVSAKIRGFFSAFIRVKSVDLPLLIVGVDPRPLRLPPAKNEIHGILGGLSLS